MLLPTEKATERREDGENERKREFESKRGAYTIQSFVHRVHEKRREEKRWGKETTDSLNVESSLSQYLPFFPSTSLSCSSPLLLLLPLLFLFAAAAPIFSIRALLLDPRYVVERTTITIVREQTDRTRERKEEKKKKKN